VDESATINSAKHKKTGYQKKKIKGRLNADNRVISDRKKASRAKDCDQEKKENSRIHKKL